MFKIILLFTFFSNLCHGSDALIEKGLMRDKEARKTDITFILQKKDLLFHDMYKQLFFRDCAVTEVHNKMNDKIVHQEMQEELRNITMEADWIVFDGNGNSIAIKKPFLSKKGIASLVVGGSLFTAAICCKGVSPTDVNFAMRALIAQKPSPEYVFNVIGKAFHLAKPSKFIEGFCDLTNSWSSDQIYEFFKPIEYIMNNHDWDLWDKIQHLWVETGGKVPAAQLVEIATKALGR